MTEKRDYHYFTEEERQNFESRPLVGPIEDCLLQALLDIIQLSEAEGMTEDQVDSVLRTIIDGRAKRVRSRFILHTDEPT